jgi:hypothetical protein
LMGSTTRTKLIWIVHDVLRLLNHVLLARWWGRWCIRIVARRLCVIEARAEASVRGSIHGSQAREATVGHSGPEPAMSSGQFWYDTGGYSQGRTRLRAVIGDDTGLHMATHDCFGSDHVARGRVVTLGWR